MCCPADICAVGIVSDRFARHNFKVKCQMAAAYEVVQPAILAQQAAQQQHSAAASRSRKQKIISPAPPSAEGRSIKQHLAGFEHCLDFEQMHAINQQMLQFGCDSLFLLLDSVALADVMSGSAQSAAQHSNVPETAPPGAEYFAELLENWGDWDEGVLDEAAAEQVQQPATCAAHNGLQLDVRRTLLLFRTW
jgi:hypothetical protein